MALQSKTAVRKDIKVVMKQLQSGGLIGISVDCVIFGFDENELKVLMIKSDLKQFEGKWSLLGELVHRDETLEEAAYRIFKERTGMDDVYLEQFRSFGGISRHPAARVVTVAYCSLINIQQHKLLNTENELHWQKVSLALDMAFDHQEILIACHEWLQKRIQEHPLGFSLLPQKFSLRELQNLYEAILGIKLDRRNFRKKFFSMDVLEDTLELEQNVPHRPGKLYKFNYAKYNTKEGKKLIRLNF